MKKRRLILAALFAVLAGCSTASATTKSATPRPSATTRATTTSAAATSAAATMSMSPSEMAAMGSASPSAGTAATQSAAAASSAPAATQASATQATATTAPVATQAPTSAPATAAPSTPAPTTAPSGPATIVTVTLVDTGIRLSTTSVSAGTVTFNVTNAGTTPHELVVLQTNIAQNALPPDPSNAAIVQEPGFLGKVANLQPKQSGTLTLTLSAASYVLICNEPAHYSALGMHIGFTAR